VITKICLHLIYHTELQNFLIAPRIGSVTAPIQLPQRGDPQARGPLGTVLQ